MLASSPCGLLFPHFRTAFIDASAWAAEEEQRGSAVKPLPLAPSGDAGATMRGGGLMPLTLDLNALPREDGPPSESVLKRQKFARFEKQCSQVAEGLYVSGEAVARDRAILAAHGISAVVNCVGALYGEFFAADGIAYRTLWLNDHPSEDITCVLYDTFDFIEAARQGRIGSTGSQASTPPSQQAPADSQQPLPQQPNQLQQPQPPQQQQQPLPQQPNQLPQQPQQLQQQPEQQQQQPEEQQQREKGLSGSCSSGGGRVLVHCSQGVSRSTTIAIAYLMYKTGGSYEETYQAVRALRGVTSPNVGFMCQLINWAKRRARPPSRVRLYRIAPHCADAPLYLVPKALPPAADCAWPDWSQLDSRGCFVAHLPDKLYVWRGECCLGVMAEAGMRAAGALCRYEGAAQPQLVRQGEEPGDLLAALNPASCCGRHVQPGNSLGCSNVPGASSSGGAGSCPCSGRQQQQQAQQRLGLGSRGRGEQQQQQQGFSAAAACSEQGSAADADAAETLLSEHCMQLASGLLGVVGEVDGYTPDYESWFSALLRSGGAPGSGRLTPRGSLVGLSADDSAASPRSASPSDAQARKYRRSESESRFLVPSFRGRLSNSNSTMAAMQQTGQDIKRMSIDEES